MQATTNICKLPSANGRAGYKWPKLTDAYMHFFGEELDGAHDALVDVRGCQRVHLHLLGDVSDSAKDEVV
jgi:DNA polymerase-3 subunit epsilon